MQRVLSIHAVFSCLSTLVLSHAIGGRQSSIPFGSLITKCTKPGVVALTFDDGPSVNTAMVLDKLKAAGQRATFFINGDNYEYIYDYNATVRRYIADGHQIGSHTWSHAHLPALSTNDAILEMTRLEDALLNILGYFPYYMRFPYLDYSTSALAVMAQLQYHVMDCDINTKDWMYNTPDTVATAGQLYTSGLDAGGTLSLAHDPEPMTAPVLVDIMINAITSRGLRSVPVGECLGAPQADWYRTGRGTPPASSSSTRTTSSSTRTSSSPVPPSSTSSSSPPPVTTTTSKSTSSAAPPSSTPSSPVPPSSTPPTTPSSTSRSVTPSGTISPDGTCGGTNGWICPSPKCCSRYGFCGTTDEYCIGQNCQPAFGKCNANLPPGTVSPDGTCGGTVGYICPSGKCCSKSNWCGTTAAYCGTGCQPAFGICT